MTAHGDYPDNRRRNTETCNTSFESWTTLMDASGLSTSFSKQELLGEQAYAQKSLSSPRRIRNVKEPSEKAFFFNKFQKGPRQQNNTSMEMKTTKGKMVESPSHAKTAERKGIRRQSAEDKKEKTKEGETKNVKLP
ncbi:unnamed protein product [Allacma fusca]|uniref:Uncharacterized protein n=1 Tax=Allacma fusca TaxID=39272 RepID=A0A8J2KGH1_9HEXA|nr:unnamed protein product [Allacma fusca]